MSTRSAPSTAITENSRRVDQIMSRYFRTSLPEGTFTEDLVTELDADTVALCKMFRLQPVRLRYEGNERRLQFEAMVVNVAGDRRVFLTNHTRNPERSLVGHELTHMMRRERPELYQELVEALANAGINKERWAGYVRAHRGQAERREDRRLTDDELREEAVADAVGDCLLDPAVWGALQRPSLLQRVRTWVAEVWQRWSAAAGLRGPAAPLGGASLFVDRGRALTAVTLVLTAWAKETADQIPSMASDDATPGP